jgi:hypothetical protein
LIKQLPALPVDSAVVTAGKLNLALTPDARTNKVEVFVDEQLLGVAVAIDFHSIVMDASSIKPGTHTVKVWAYDRFLNRAEYAQSIDFQ